LGDAKCLTPKTGRKLRRAQPAAHIREAAPRATLNPLAKTLRAIPHAASLLRSSPAGQLP
jgi:hypothetical protein